MIMKGWPTVFQIQSIRSGESMLAICRRHAEIAGVNRRYVSSMTPPCNSRQTTHRDIMPGARTNDSQPRCCGWVVNTSLNITNKQMTVRQCNRHALIATQLAVSFSSTDLKNNHTEVTYGRTLTK